MSDYRTRNLLLLSKPEAVSGVEETPTPAANAVKARFPLNWAANFPPVDTDYVTGSLSASEPIVGGGNVALPISCYLKGAGAGAGGTAPDIGVLLRGAGLSQTLTAAAVTGTAQAGAASSITLHAGASAVDDAYKGMVIRTTGGTGSGQVAAITAYAGATKIATVTPAWTVTPDITTTFSIDANALYRPVSTGLETLTHWLYQHHNNPATNSRRRRLKGSAATASIAVRTRGLVEFAAQFTGQLVANPDDVAKPAAPTYQASSPEVFVNAQAFLGNGAVKFSECSFDLGGTVEQFDDPGSTYGYDVAGVIGRVAAGRITPNLTLNSSRDAFADWQAATERALWLRWGSVAGKRVSLLCPRLRYIGQEPADVRGFAAEALPFRAVGEDAEIWICTH